MGAIAEMTHEGQTFADGMDAVVIRRAGACLIGGRTLDMSALPDVHVKAGHIIIRQIDTDTYRPLGVDSGGAYEALPEGCEYAGVLRASKRREQPFASIMYEGEVNDLCTPYPMTETLVKELRASLPSLYFMHD